MSLNGAGLYGDDSTEDPRGFVAGPNGIYIVGETINEGTFVSSIDRDGDIRWERDFARLDINDIGMDVLENLYIVGRDVSETDGVANVGSFDVIVTKYDAEGTRLLSMAFGTEDAERGIAIAGDQLGHIYVTGYSTGNLDGQTTSAAGTFFCPSFSCWICPRALTSSLTAPSNYSSDVEMPTDVRPRSLRRSASVHEAPPAVSAQAGPARLR